MGRMSYSSVTVLYWVRVLAVGMVLLSAVLASPLGAESIFG